MHELAPVIEEMIRKHHLPWRLAENGVHVGLRHRQRGQYVQIDRHNGFVFFSSVVLGNRAVTKKISRWRELARLVWHRNSTCELVTFCFDRDDRLIGRILHPEETLDPEEIRIYIENLASECDRFEYLLCGADEN